MNQNLPNYGYGNINQNYPGYPPINQQGILLIYLYVGKNEKVLPKQTDFYYLSESFNVTFLY